MEGSVIVYQFHIGDPLLIFHNVAYVRAIQSSFQSFKQPLDLLKKLAYIKNYNFES